MHEAWLPIAKGILPHPDHAQGRDWRGFAQTDMPHFRKLLCFCIATQKPPPECFLVGAGDGDEEEEEDDDEDDDEEDSSSLGCW